MVGRRWRGGDEGKEMEGRRWKEGYGGDNKG